MVRHLRRSGKNLFSDDSGHTWQPEVLIDELIGAYPSMVNLNDGSVLVVYYEEGQGSSIRAKRFRITSEGLEWVKPPAISLGVR